ncbi:N-acetylneuraminate lyase-like [Chelonus insularis]|uniref:N-acetylneuraminate lyase-like n=1 Tax=Chelonus insularis TaxID=460826 RepID=UPI00158B8E33|nr:N-acetylneuraminate lyase-like [Chelonus insularis]
MPRLPYNFRGYIAPVFTPVTAEKNLNLSIISEYAKYLSKNGIQGVLVNGTSGEGMSMSVADRKKVAEAWAGAIKETRQHLMIQVGGASLPDVIQLAKHAEKIKADSILCLPELYFKPNNSAQLIEYLKIVSEAAPKTPLLYYHIPMFTHVNIHMGEFLNKIGDTIPTFVGIKFTSNNLEEGAQAVEANSKKNIIFLGNDQLMSAAFAVGMDSFIATSVNIFPDIAIKILETAKKGDCFKANEIQKKLSQAVIAISKYGNWVVTMKTAMALLSPLDPGPVCEPLKPLSDEDIQSMKRDLGSLGFMLNG